MVNSRRRYIKRSRFKDILFSHIEKNLKEYIISALIFVIGILLGVVFFNSLNEVQTSEISNYLNDSITALKNNENINELRIIKENILKNFTLVVILWLMGSTVIGLLLVYVITCFKGFSFGYTISSIIFILGTKNGLVFSGITLFLKNIITIPCLLALSVSGMKVYKSIMNDRRKENIKLEIVRHTLFCIFILGILIVSSIIETYITKYGLCSFIEYI